jgi:hypothetical protein
MRNTKNFCVLYSVSLADILLTCTNVFWRGEEVGVVDKTTSCWNGVSFKVRRLPKFFAQSSKTPYCPSISGTRISFPLVTKVPAPG